MRTVNGAKVLITGAASGMGWLYAQRAAREGASAVILWDRDAEGLERAVQSFSGVTRILTYVVDLSDLASIQRATQETLSEVGAPDVLINNAGIVTGNAYFWEMDSIRETEQIIRVNTLAHMFVTREFMPAMIEDASRPKRILNIASAAATVSNPRMSVYAASKWAMYGWSDSLRLELSQAGHQHVAVTTFCPSYVSTGMFAGARGMFLTPILQPEAAVQSAWNAMLQAKPVQLTPWAVNLAKLLKGILPVRVWDRAASAMGVYRSMDAFSGRVQGKSTR